MNIQNLMPVSLLRTLCAAVVMLLGTAGCYAQNTPALAVFGEPVDVSEVARPEWREENGKSVARMVLLKGDAAAWQLNFRTLNLPEGAQMFLYGTDAATGATVSAHGPYEGHGPVNVPEFATEVIAGNSVVVEIRSSARLQELPFSLESAEKISAERLAELKQGGLVVNTRVTPNIRRANPNPDMRSMYIGDRLIQYEVVDGKAIFEGDISLGKVEELGSRFGAVSSKSKQKQGHITTDDPFTAYWPSGRVAYRITYSGFYGITQGGALDLSVKAAIAHWNSLLPGILYPRTNETNFVTVELDSSACQADSVGRGMGEQFIEVATTCTTGNLIHEFGHVLGLHHEHTRPDRNTFVTINWGNIQWGKGAQFEIPTAGDSAASGAYDFGSIMQYPLLAFSSNGNATISVVGTAPAGVTIGQRSALSAGDQATIRRLYCTGSTKGPGLIELDAEAGGGSFTFTAPPYCSWTVTSTASATWLKVTSSPNSSNVTFTVTANTGRYDRSASIYYNGRSTVVRQEGVGIFGKEF